MNENKISIITVVRNDKTNIRATINSVLSQTYSNIEYIVIDGASMDGTLDIIREYENQIAELISEPDKGVYDAMNKGTAIATGKWICYMNSGDQFADTDVLYRIFIDNKNNVLDKDVIYSDVIADYKTKQKIRIAKNLKLFYQGIPFSHQAHLIKASIAKNKPFNLKYAITADYDFLYAIFKESAKFYYFEHPIAIVDVTTGISKNVNLNILYKDFLEINKKYSTIIQITYIYLRIPTEILYAFLRGFIINRRK